MHMLATLIHFESPDVDVVLCMSVLHDENPRSAHSDTENMFGRSNLEHYLDKLSLFTYNNLWMKDSALRFILLCNIKMKGLCTIREDEEMQMLVCVVGLG